MRVVVPFDPGSPNTRLSAVLSSDERREFADAMLADVLSAVRAAGGDPEILSTAAFDVTDLDANGDSAPVTVDDRDLSAAVNDALAEGLPAAVVMADLALATPDALTELFDTAGDVVVAPGRGGGTNALVVRTDGFAVDYHGVSYADHVAAAEAAGASVATVDSFRLAVDVDDPPDLLEVLVHGTGSAAEWLRNAGFAVVVEDGEPTVTRESGG
ncbi:2-phospho-L-lactate guanylyltransferase [Halobacterium zhouii]|uniref:2-phospho-L-lactate guanylyltransferase n=1 Tax=Halobacterium zhouii TaxID=2902624 RepID=UPI001E3C55CE|nr:2-phospho-L-lactate guanylyltransferase [Halobacterium zhouii]